MPGTEIDWLSLAKMRKQAVKYRTSNENQIRNQDGDTKTNRKIENIPNSDRKTKRFSPTKPQADITLPWKRKRK